jgi:hypothetical protein
MVKKKQIDSKMVCLGDDQTYTAMAKQWDYLLQLLLYKY